MRRTLMLAVTAMVLVAVTGCKTPPEGAYVPEGNRESPEARGSQVVLLNHDLIRTLAVDQPLTVGRTDNGSQRLQVGLRNRTNDEVLQLQAQTLWFNESHRVLYSEPGSEAAWQTITISPNQTYYYKSAALTPEAAQFTVRVRYVKGAK